MNFLSTAVLAPGMGCGPGSPDANIGTLSGSPLDQLPPGFTQITDFGLRASWSPDGRQILFLDGLAGDVWTYDLPTEALRSRTQHFEHAGFSRARHLANGDLVLCGPVERDLASSDPEEGRFDGVLWILRRPFDGKPLPLDEPCWEGIAAARQGNRIAWVRSKVDYTSWDFVWEGLFGPSELWIGEVRYEGDTPKLVDRRRVVTRDDIARLSLLEVQDFRPPVEDEILFTAFNYQGGEVMGVHLETGEIKNYSQSPWFDEADGVFPDGRSTLVVRELDRVFVPEQVDLWRLTLDGRSQWERLTSFTHYRGYGASNAVVSPDGRRIVFQLRDAAAPPGNGLALLLLDLDAIKKRP